MRTPASGRVAAQARQFAQEITDGVKRSADCKKQAALEGMKKELETMVGRVKQVRRQARERLFGGKVFLEVWVKVRRGWTESETTLKRMGYGDQ